MYKYVNRIWKLKIIKRKRKNKKKIDSEYQTINIFGQYQNLISSIIKTVLLIMYRKLTKNFNEVTQNEYEYIITF